MLGLPALLLSGPAERTTKEKQRKNRPGPSSVRSSTTLPRPRNPAILHLQIEIIRPKDLPVSVSYPIPGPLHKIKQTQKHKTQNPNAKTQRKNTTQKHNAKTQRKNTTQKHNAKTQRKNTTQKHKTKTENKNTKHKTQNTRHRNAERKNKMQKHNAKTQDKQTLRLHPLFVLM